MKQSDSIKDRVRRVAILFRTTDTERIGRRTGIPRRQIREAIRAMTRKGEWAAVKRTITDGGCIGVKWTPLRISDRIVISADADQGSVAEYLDSHIALLHINGAWEIHVGLLSNVRLAQQEWRFRARMRNPDWTQDQARRWADGWLTHTTDWSLEFNRGLCTKP